MRLRPVSPHAVALHEHLARLEPSERRLRLGRHVEADAIAAYCSRPQMAPALILGTYIRGKLVATGELTGLPALRRRDATDPSVAELRIAVEPAFRNRGLASIICGRMVLDAARRRVTLVSMTYDPDNISMMRLATRSGAIHYRVGNLLRAELCTGWLGEELAPSLIEDSPGFRPISLH